MPTWWSRLQRFFHRAGDPAAGLAAAADAFVRPRPGNDRELPDERAVRKARTLLERALTPQQRSDLSAKGWFYVAGKRNTYRIREGHSANVDALDSSGSVVSRLCAHPLGRSPVYDVMLAQKLWIETDEAMFLRKAAACPPCEPWTRL